jgi:hypothetical protein
LTELEMNLLVFCMGIGLPLILLGHLILSVFLWVAKSSNTIVPGSQIGQSDVLQLGQRIPFRK